MTHTTPAEYIQANVIPVLDKLTADMLPHVTEATQAAAERIYMLGANSSQMAAEIDSLTHALGHITRANDSLRESAAHIAAYITEGTSDGTAPPIDRRPTPDIYGLESEQGWWRPTDCFHMVELRALGHAAAEMSAIQPERAAAMSSLAGATRAQCEAVRGSLQSKQCPLLARLGSLAWYVENTHEQRMQIAAARGAHLRKFPVGEQHKALAATIDQAAAEAYFIWSRVSGLSPDNIRRQPGSCAYIAAIMQQTLHRRGVESELREYTSGDIFYHYFLRLQGQNGEEFDADGTWQQFFPEATQDDVYKALPHALILPVSQREAAIAAHQVPEGWREVWGKSRSSRAAWWRFGDRRLHKVFEAEGRR